VKVIVIVIIVIVIVIVVAILIVRRSVTIRNCLAEKQDARTLKIVNESLRNSATLMPKDGNTHAWSKLWCQQRADTAGDNAALPVRWMADNANNRKSDTISQLADGASQGLHWKIQGASFRNCGLQVIETVEDPGGSFGGRAVH